MKLEPETKINKKNTETSKKVDDDVMSLLFNLWPISILPEAGFRTNGI